jgi:hypothetical protein
MLWRRPKRRMRPRAASRRMTQASFDTRGVMRGEMRVRRVDMMESPLGSEVEIARCVHGDGWAELLRFLEKE